MCLCCQPPDEEADSINLSQKVPLAPQQGAATALVPAQRRQAAAGEEEEAPEENDGLPEWSERVASGILTGLGSHNLLNLDQPEPTRR